MIESHCYIKESREALPLSAAAQLLIYMIFHMHLNLMISRLLCSNPIGPIRVKLHSTNTSTSHCKTGVKSEERHYMALKLSSPNLPMVMKSSSFAADIVSVVVFLTRICPNLSKSLRFKLPLPLELWQQMQIGDWKPKFWRYPSQRLTLPPVVAINNLASWTEQRNGHIELD